MFKRFRGRQPRRTPSEDLEKQFPFVPQALGGSLEGLRALCIGTCQAAGILGDVAAIGVSASHMLYETRALNPAPDVDPDGFDFIVVAPALRHLLWDALGDTIGNADVSLARITTSAQRETLLLRTNAILQGEVEKFRDRFPSLPIFFLSMIEPSVNYLGLLVDRFDPCSPQVLVRSINEQLSRAIQASANVYYLEINDVLNAVGRTRLQDDMAGAGTHAGFMQDWDLEVDHGRLQPGTPRQTTFDWRAARAIARRLIWRQLTDGYRILRQADPIKLVIVDLDDTLWRGVVADDNYEHWRLTEGWPTGFVEALLFFKRRGGLLAICSKNEAEPTLERLLKIWKGALVLEDFVAIQINWRPKPENIADIIKTMNLLPKNVLFIDDNPREIDEVKAVFPDMRTLSAEHYDWRRILLGAPETQVAKITAESQARTETTRALVKRHLDGGALPRDEWLRSLGLRQRVLAIADGHAPQFGRALELLNKTNQFNTNGRRWDHGELSRFVADGGMCIVSAVRDKTVDNGIVCVALLRGSDIVQVVLSCRVFGLGIETAVGSLVTQVALRAGGPATGVVTDTGKNFVCHRYFESVGFTQVGDRFETFEACEVPNWIELETDLQPERLPRSEEVS